MNRLQALGLLLLPSWALLFGGTALAQSANAASAAPLTWPSLGAPPQALKATGSKDAALIVAIESYDALDPIAGAAQNGLDWYQYLVDGIKVPSERVKLLTNKEAVDATIRREAKNAAERVEEGGTVWFVFIGHGIGNASREPLLIGADARVDTVYERGIPQSEAASILGAGKGRARMVLDTCFSGRDSRGAPLVAGRQATPPSSIVPPSNTVMYTAAASDEFAGPLPGFARPAFSYLFLGALRGWGDADKNGIVTEREAMAYTQKAMVMLPLGRTQSPASSGPLTEAPLSEGATESGPNLRPRVEPPAVVAPPVLESPRDIVDRAQARQRTRAGMQMGGLWSLIGSGSAALGSAALFAVSASSVSSIESGDIGSKSFEDAYASAKLQRGFAIGVGIGAVALLAVGIGLFAFQPSETPGPTAAAKRGVIRW